MASTKNPHAARLLKELRVDRGLSTEALAWEVYKEFRVKISGRTIRRIEDEHTVPTPRVQFALARYFELRPSQVWPCDLKVAA